MTPDERIAQLENEVQQLRNELNGFYADPQADPRFFSVINALVTAAVAQISINDLADVDTSGVVNGEVLKYNAGTWENGIDLT